VSSWAALSVELELWRASGRTPTFWWRDDDATAPAKALDRLLAIAAGLRAPVALAVIPAAAETALAERLDDARVSILQHGYAHANHAPDGERKAELGHHRTPAVMLAELAEGARRLAGLFGGRSRPVLVPPWNRIDPALAVLLPGIALSGLSTYRARPSAHPAFGLTLVNTHVDIVDWNARRFLGEDAALALTVHHLAARRAGRVDETEATGLLTHHAVHEPAAWRFIERLIAAVRSGGGRWLAAEELFGAP
jgi:hypothetical protein